MSLVDYGFYSDEEEEEEEKERQRPQKQELPDSGPLTGSRSSNDSVPDVSCPPQPAGFFQQHNRKESLSSTVSPQQEVRKGVAFIKKENEEALLSPLSRKKRSAASLSRAEPTADESVSSADLLVRRQWESEDTREAISSDAAVRRGREGGAAADQADAEERTTSDVFSDATAAAVAGPRKRARENRHSPGISAEASSNSPSPAASLLQQQPLQSEGTSPRDSSSAVKQQIVAIATLSAGDAVTAANQTAPPVNVDSEHDTARSTLGGSSCLAAASSSMPLPTLPPGEAPKELLRTVERLRQLRARGITVNGNIAASLDFKNPYLLEKIMKVFDIDPYCSNYSVSVFDPSNIIPWEPRAGTPFAVQLVRRFEQRRQQRREAHAATKEVKEDPSATTSVGNSAVVGTHAAAPAAAGHTSASTAGGSAVAAAHQASSAEASEGPAEGGAHRPRSRFERISPPAAGQQQQHTAAPASGFSSVSTGLPAGAPLMTGSGFNAALQHAAFEAMVKAGAMASVVQQQLQQRLLTMHSALAAQQQHCGSMASRDASSAAAMAAAAAAAAMSYRSQQQQHPLQQQVQQNGPSTAGAGLNRQRPSTLPFSSSPPLPTVSTIAGHATAAGMSGAASSSAGGTASASSHVGGAVAAASGLRSGDSTAAKSREEANVKNKQPVKPSPVQSHQGEKDTLAGINTVAQQHHLEPMPRRQPASSVTSSSTRWGDSRGERSSNTSSTSRVRGDVRSVSSVHESVKAKATAGTESKRKF